MTEQKTSPRIIALVGLSGVGKSKAVELVSTMMTFEAVYFGGVVLAEVRARGLDPTPDSEAAVREDLRREFGMAAMAHKSLPAILEALGTGRHVLIDGLYSYAEYKLLGDRFGDALAVIAVHARKTVRIARLAARPVRPLTAAEMALRDAREVDRLEKAPPIALADYHVVNDGSEADLRAALEACVEAITMPAG